MEADDFIQMLGREGYAAPVPVERAPNGRLDEHTHPIEAKALILEGEIRIVTAGRERVYGPGQVFHLQANEAHAESYGPQGVRYLSGRK